MLSIVVPVLDEEESIRHFYRELSDSLKGKDYEVIFIDDGSRDNTFNILRNLVSKDKHIKLFSFRKNQGKAEALTQGFRKAKGDLIVTLDADLQDKPSQILKLLEKQKEGWDLVSGWRIRRRDSFRKIISSKLFNFIATTFWGIKVNDLNSGLKLYTKDAAKSLNLYGGMHRFIPLLLHQEGFRVTEVPVVHDQRKFGKSKYGFSKIFKDLPDMFTMLFLSRYSYRPLHFFGIVGSVFFFIGLIVLAYLSVLHFQGRPIGDRPLLIFGAVLVLGGFQILFTGFLADLILHLSLKTNANKEEFSKHMFKYESDK